MLPTTALCALLLAGCGGGQSGATPATVTVTASAPAAVTVTASAPAASTATPDSASTPPGEGEPDEPDSAATAGYVVRGIPGLPTTPLYLRFSGVSNSEFNAKASSFDPNSIDIRCTLDASGVATDVRMATKGEGGAEATVVTAKLTPKQTLTVQSNGVSAQGAPNASLGRPLVSSNGRTLYFDARTEAKWSSGGKPVFATVIGHVSCGQ